MNLQIVIVGSESWTSSLKRCWRFMRLKEGRRKHNKALTFEVNPTRGFFFGIFAVIALYLIGAVGLYAWRMNVPNNHIGFTDILIAPVAMDRISRLQGQTNLDNAREMLERKKYQDAFYNYRAGVARLPDDLQARLELAQFYMAAGFVPEATNLLINGLSYGYPENPDYLKSLLASIQYNDNNPALLKFLPIMLAFPEVQNDQSKRLAMMQLLLKAQLKERDYAGVIRTSELLNREGVEKTFYDTALFARLKMGAFVDAQTYLQTIPEEELEQPDIFLLNAILVYSDQDKAQGRAMFQRIFRDYPNEWRNQLDIIMFLFQEGDDKQATELMNVYASLHRRNMAALSNLTARLTDVPAPDKVREFGNMIGEFAPQFLGAIIFYYVQALITDGQFEEAEKEMAVIRSAAPAEGAEGEVFKAYDLIIQAANERSKGEYTEMREYLEETRLPAEIYWEAGEAMRKVGAFDVAELALNAGLNRYPFDRSLSQLRTTVLEQSAAAKQDSNAAVSSVRESGYRNQRISSTDAMAERFITLDPAVGSPPESLINSDKLRDVEIDQEDFNKAAEVQ